MCRIHKNDFETLRLSEYNITLNPCVKWRESMDFISVKEAAKRWCISERWVQEFY